MTSAQADDEGSGPPHHRASQGNADKADRLEPLGTYPSSSTNPFIAEFRLKASTATISHPLGD